MFVVSLSGSVYRITTSDIGGAAVPMAMNDGLVSAVPEPSAVAISLIAFVVVAFRRHRSPLAGMPRRRGS
jgi:hypothetical protein